MLLAIFAMAGGDERGVLEAYVSGVVKRAGERVVYYVQDCPAAKACSHSSWDRVKAWSFDDSAGALGVCKRHFMNFSNHSMCEEDAAALLVNVRCHTYKQEWED